MNIKYVIVVLTMLVGTLSWCAASNPCPKIKTSLLAQLYENSTGEAQGAADVTPGILAMLNEQNLGQLAIIGRTEQQRLPNLYQDAIDELLKRKITQFLQTHNDNVDEALFDAAKNNKAWAINYLVKNGADVITKDNYGWTALSWAAAKGYEAAVAQLLAAGANVNAKTYIDNTALMKAAEQGHGAVVAQLLANGADVNATSKIDNTALMQAAQFGHETVVARLITTRANVNAKNKYGTTPIMQAAIHGLGTVVTQLITARADINAKNGNDRTALYCAADRGYEAIAVQLITAGADYSDLSDNLKKRIEEWLGTNIKKTLI